MTQFKTIQNPSSVTAAFKAYRAQCVEIKAEAERCYPTCHIVGRGVEILALDETGERNDGLGGPDFIAAKDLTVKYLKEFVVHALKSGPGPNNEHRLAAVHICGGFDIYDSFQDYMDAMKGDWMDHDIYGDYAGADIPVELLT